MGAGAEPFGATVEGAVASRRVGRAGDASDALGGRVNGSTIAVLVLAVEYLACSYGRLYITRWRPWR